MEITLGGMEITLGGMEITLGGMEIPLGGMKTLNKCDRAYQVFWCLQSFYQFVYYFS